MSQPTVRRLVPNFADGRGIIMDLLCEPCDSVTIVTTRAGAERGHHYHKTSTQFVYLLEGAMEVRVKAADGTVLSAPMRPGDLYENPPMEAHVLVAIEDSVFLSMTRGPKHRGDTVAERVE